MKVNLSPAEIGVIVSALQQCYQSGSAESELAIQLCNEVCQHLSDYGLFEQWLDEFDIEE